MESKSLLGAGLSSAASTAAYFLYAMAIYKQDKSWVVIAAFIYFFPLFIDFAENLQSTRIHNKKMFIVIAVCFIIGVAYIALLLGYLATNQENMNDTIWGFFKVILVAIPVVCMPINIYPLFVRLLQLYNRSNDRNHGDSV